MKRDNKSSEHFIWGQNCDGWHLLKTDSLSVIQDAPNTSEDLHYHQKAQQFFYVLLGQATFEMEGEIFEIKSNEGFYVAANKKHKIKNESNTDLHFLVISASKSHGDRTNI